MRRYFAALLEQALWSLLNLGVNVALARFAAPETYGSFVFWASCGVVLSSLQNALTLCHLQVLTPDDGLAPHRLETERTMHAVTVVYMGLVAAATLAITLASKSHSEFDAPAAALFLPAYVFQQYLRSLSFSRGDAKGAAVQTGLVLVLAAALLGAAADGAVRLDSNGVMLIMAAAYGIVGLGSAVRLCAPQMIGRRWPRLRDYLPFTKQSGWVFLGVTSAELLSRLYAFVVAATSGPGPLAAMAATQLFLRPLPLLAQSWAMGGRADLLSRRDRGDWPGVLRWVGVAVVGGLAATLVWAPAVDFAWPFISRHVFDGKYLEFRWMVLIWGAASACNFAQVVISAAIQGLRAFKPLAIANAISSAVAAVGIVAAAALWGYAGALIGTALGMLLDVVVMSVLLASLIRVRRQV